MLSMNRECKLINIIGTDALRLQFHFLFKRSPKLGRYSGGTLQSTAFVLLNEDASSAGP